MSLKSIFENITQSFSTDSKMKKYEDVLHNMVEGSFVVNNSAIKHIYISLKRNADINTVKEIYAKVGIKLQQRIMKTGNKFIPVLCILALDFEKLGEKQREFFNRTTNADKITR